LISGGLELFLQVIAPRLTDSVAPFLRGAQRQTNTAATKKTANRGISSVLQQRSGLVAGK